MKHLRILPLFLSLLLLLPLLIPSAAAATPPSVTGVDAVYVMNLEYGQAVFAQNESKRLYPASTAKLVTALVAEKHFAEDLDQKIEITEEMKAAFRGRALGLTVGERITVEALLHAMLVGGYNDAAIVLAFATAGDLASFCAKMNECALALGATETHYTNPTGLHDPAMVTTARDTAYIAVELMKHETLYAITKKPKCVLSATNKSDERTVYSRNSLISSILEEDYYYSYADGIHAGSTDEGGDCVVTSGRLDGLSYVCVVLGGRSSDGKNAAFPAASNALRYALKTFTVKTLKTKKAEVATLPVLYSATVAEVAVHPKEDLTALLPSDFDLDDVVFETSLAVTELEAPFESGTVVGRILARDKNAKILAATDLIVTETVDAHGFLLFMARLKGFVLSPVFFILLAIVAALILGSVYYDKKHPRRRRRFWR
ncbi:MAG: D-alanyl-D-alanine carboxypeptidase [Ruminococcaceae bacterium]|nr:D-alanyl-D-alanine carboxypeptidase [Oscillospiraceae bacterium]